MKTLITSIVLALVVSVQSQTITASWDKPDDYSKFNVRYSSDTNPEYTKVENGLSNTFTLDVSGLGDVTIWMQHAINYGYSYTEWVVVYEHIDYKGQVESLQRELSNTKKELETTKRKLVKFKREIQRLKRRRWFWWFR